MAWSTANLLNVRAEVIRRLYVTRDVISDTADAAGDTASIISNGKAASGVHLSSAVYTSNDYVAAWVYVPGVAAPQQSRVTAYDRDGGDLTISPAVGATCNAEPYEIHYLIPPERLNDWIKIRAREGSSGAMTTIAEGTAINIDKFTLAEGVLADALRFLAKREQGETRRLLESEADHHELLWLRKLALLGLRPLVVRLKIQREDTEEAQTLRRF